MARRFLDDVRADIDANINTNGVRAITGAIENGILHDLIDSTIQDEAAIGSNTSSGGVVTGIDWAPLPATVYDEQTGGDGDFLKTDFAAGTITTSATPGFTYAVSGLVSITDASNNREIDFTILQNGLPVGFVAHNVGQGNNRPISLSFGTLELSTPANAVYQIGVRTPAGANTVDIVSIVLSATIRPTNNP